MASTAGLAPRLAALLAVLVLLLVRSAGLLAPLLAALSVGPLAQSSLGTPALLLPVAGFTPPMPVVLASLAPLLLAPTWLSAGLASLSTLPVASSALLLTSLLLWPALLAATLASTSRLSRLSSLSLVDLPGLAPHFLVATPATVPTPTASVGLVQAVSALLQLGTALAVLPGLPLALLLGVLSPRGLLVARPTSFSLLALLGVAPALLFVSSTRSVVLALLSLGSVH